jgi:hypothetical protein
MIAGQSVVQRGGSTKNYILIRVVATLFRICTLFELDKLVIEIDAFVFEIDGSWVAYRMARGPPGGCPAYEFQGHVGTPATALAGWLAHGISLTC